MKRRTLLSSALWSSVLACVVPARATSVSDSRSEPRPNQSKSPAPYEAVKLVYESFAPMEPSCEIEFSPRLYWVGNPENHQSSVKFKLVALADNQDRHHDTWLCFHDSVGGFPERSFLRKDRELRVVRILSEGVHQLTSSEEYDVEKRLMEKWFHNGKIVVTVSEQEFSHGKTCRLETSPIFRTSHLGYQDPEVLALARFLALVTG